MLVTAAPRRRACGEGCATPCIGRALAHSRHPQMATNCKLTHFSRHYQFFEERKSRNGGFFQRGGAPRERHGCATATKHARNVNPLTQRSGRREPKARHPLKNAVPGQARKPLETNCLRRVTETPYLRRAAKEPVWKCRTAFLAMPHMPCDTKRQALRTPGKAPLAAHGHP